MHRTHLWIAAALVSLNLWGCQAISSPAPAEPAPNQQTSAVETPPSPGQDPKPDPKLTQDPHPADPAQKNGNVVQMAILLDTSNSMDGLIDQAKAQLWKIVNELSSANQGGHPPRLEVALYEYGKSTQSGNQGYVHQLLPFTSDLDKVSEELFKLRTNGGLEYCGWAMRSALSDLEWNPDPKALKVIFIAGNEPFNQGPVAYKPVCAQAQERGILINTIFCGDRLTGRNQGWEDGALAGQGRFLAIDTNQQLAYVEAPQDQELARLSSQLNSSYVPYGAEGGASQKRQMSMDSASMAVAPAVASERAVAKSSSNYDNSNWDLVDAADKGKVDLSQVKAEELPAEMRGLKADEREAYVEKKRAERQQITDRINQLNVERQKYLATQQKKNQGQTLDDAVLEAVRSQATSKGYRFKS